MKRSRLNRYTPLKPGRWRKQSEAPGTLGGAINQNKGGMRRVSKKPKYPGWKLERDRTAWKALFSHCWICRRWFQWLHCHEIAAKGTSPNRWCDRCNFFATCADCHEKHLDGPGNMPHARQLAYKVLNDLAHYDLAKWIEIRGRAETSITQAEVNRELRKLTKQLGLESISVTWKGAPQ